MITINTPRPTARRYAKGLTGLAIALAAAPALAQQTYNEITIYNDSGTTTFTGVTADTRTRLSVDSIVSVSLTESGAYGGRFVLIDNEGTLTTDDDESINVILRGDVRMANTAEVLLQDPRVSDPDFITALDCRMEDDNDCVDYDIEEAFMNNVGWIAFRAGWVQQNGDPGGTIALWEDTNGERIRILVPQSVNVDADSYRPDALWGFNNFNAVIGTMDARCDGSSDAFEAGFRSTGGITSGDIRGVSATTPPVPTFLDECEPPEPSVVQRQVRFFTPGGISPNGNAIFFSGESMGPSDQTGLFRTGDLGLEFTGIRDMALSPVVVNDFVSAVYTTAGFDGEVEIVQLEFDEATGVYTRNLVISENDDAWFEIDPTSIDYNSNNQIAFVGRRNATEAPRVWVFNPFLELLDEAGGAGLTNLTIGPNSLNENGEVLAWGEDANGLFQMVLLSPTTPAAPTATLSVQSLTFGNLAVGQSERMPVTLTNMGNQNLQVQALEVTPTASGFVVVNNTCPFVLMPQSSCTFDVEFAPMLAGPANADLFLASNDPDQPEQFIPLSGNSTVAVPDIELPSTVTFSDISTAASASETVVIRNAGSGPLNVSSISTPNPPFAISTDTCAAPLTLAAAAECSFVVNFASTMAGSFNGQIQVVSDDPDSPAAVIELVATAVTPAVAVQVFDSFEPFFDQTLNFGSVRLGESETGFFTVRNTGQMAVTLGAAMLEPGSDTQFTVVAAQDTCSSNILAPDDTCTVEVEYLPVATGDSSGAVVLPVMEDDDIRVALIGRSSEFEFDLEIELFYFDEFENSSGIPTLDVIVRNNGRDTATGVTTFLNLPDNLVGDRSRIVTECAFSQPVCFGEPGFYSAANWEIGDLGPGSGAVARLLFLDVPAATEPGDCVILNADVRGPVGDVDFANNVARLPVGTGNCADLVVTTDIVGLAPGTGERLDPMFLGPRVTTDYLGIATIRNNGPDAIESVNVFGAASLNVFRGAGIDGSVSTEPSGCLNNPTLIGEVCELGTLPPGESREVTLAARVTRQQGWTAQYEVSVTGSDDPDPAKQFLHDG